MADSEILTPVELTEKLAVPPYSGPNGLKFIGLLIGLTNQMQNEAAATALSAQWLKTFTPGHEYDHPLQGLDAIGAASGLPRYPGEDYITEYLPRLLSRWTLWTQGIKSMLVSEFASAGFSGVEIEVPTDFDPRPDPVDYWSRFWVRFPVGSHPITDPEGFVVGTSIVGSEYIGPEGFDSVDGSLVLGLIKQIVQRLKPSQWVCWDLVFELGGGDEVRLQVHSRFQDENYVYFNG